ncbi:MAG: hypothetical protein FWD97_07805 [Defluviitaleaceae bacterium]|nr:hypothetical protein [Defluviitaleaceae bacterium]
MVTWQIVWSIILGMVSLGLFVVPVFLYKTKGKLFTVLMLFAGAMVSLFAIHVMTLNPYFIYAIYLSCGLVLIATFIKTKTVKEKTNE